MVVEFLFLFFSLGINLKYIVKNVKILIFFAPLIAVMYRIKQPNKKTRILETELNYSNKIIFI